MYYIYILSIRRKIIKTGNKKEVREVGKHLKRMDVLSSPRLSLYTNIVSSANPRHLSHLNRLTPYDRCTDKASKAVVSTALLAWKSSCS